MKIIRPSNRNNTIFQKIYTCSRCMAQFKIEPGDQPLEINIKTFWREAASEKYAKYACPECFETWDILFD